MVSSLKAECSAFENMASKQKEISERKQNEIVRLNQKLVDTNQDLQHFKTIQVRCV
jgi:hypothetical protein